jgi:penicillin-binding protein-related factor A (putative recombinase)
MNSLFYLLDGKTLLSFIENNTRKSIPYEFIKNNAYELEYNYNKGLNYLEYVDIIGGFENEKN